MGGHGVGDHSKPYPGNPPEAPPGLSCLHPLHPSSLHLRQFHPAVSTSTFSSTPPSRDTIAARSSERSGPVSIHSADRGALPLQWQNYPHSAILSCTLAIRCMCLFFLRVRHPGVTRKCKRRQTVIWSHAKNMNLTEISPSLPLPTVGNLGLLKTGEVGKGWRKGKTLKNGFHSTTSIRCWILIRGRPGTVSVSPKARSERVNKNCSPMAR